MYAGLHEFVWLVGFGVLVGIIGLGIARIAVWVVDRIKH